MNLVCVGISHHTAPLEVREQLWFSDDEIRRTLPLLAGRGCSEGVLFSTCNRTELYAFAEQKNYSADFLKSLLLEQKAPANNVAAMHLFSYAGNEAAGHLFRVASGIDSMVLGDVQILAQVKDGLNAALERKTARFFMNRLFQTAFHVGKRSRSETEIGDGAVSVGYAAVELAERIFDDLSKRTALVVGAGETAKLTCIHLRGKGIGRLLITNRTTERAEQLASEARGEVIPFEHWQEVLPEVNIVVSAVDVDRYILSTADVARLNKHRKSGALFFIDLGVPRNVEPEVKKLENVFLYNLDNLNSMVDENLRKRQGEVPKVEAIIGEEVGEFTRWYSSLEANPTISALTDFMEQIRKEELEKHVHRFEPKDRKLMELVTKRIVNKILHTPIVNLKNGHDEPASERLHAVSVLRKLFGIGTNAREKMNGE